MAEKKVRGIKSGPATPVAFVPVVEDVSPYDKAQQLAANPAMVVPANNPLVTETPQQMAESRIQEHNMEQLYKDARLRRNPANGAVYAGIMATRYPGGSQDV